MSKESLAYVALPKRAIAINDTVPDPGKIGVLAWSTITADIVRWNGTSWQTIGTAAAVNIPSVLTLEDTPEQTHTASTGLKLHAYDLGGVHQLSVAGANSERDVRLQSSFGDVLVHYGYPSGSYLYGLGQFDYVAGYGVADTSGVSIGSAGPASYVIRSAYKTATTAGSAAGFRMDYIDHHLMRGMYPTHRGFLFSMRFGYGGNTAQQFALGHRAFVGLATRYNGFVGDQNFLNFNTQGMGLVCDAGETNWSFISCYGSASYTKTPLGSGFPVGLTSAAWTASFYEFLIISVPGSGSIFWKLRALHNDPITEVSGTYNITANMPRDDVIQYPNIWVSNGATTLAPSCFVTHMYAEVPNI